MHNQVGHHDSDGIAIVASVVGFITLRHLMVGVGNGPQVVSAGGNPEGDSEAGVIRIGSTGRQAADGPAAQVSVPAADDGVGGEVELDHETPRVAITPVVDSVGHRHRLALTGRNWRVDGLHDQVRPPDDDDHIVAGVVPLVALGDVTVGVGNGPQVVNARCSIAGDGEVGVGRIGRPGRQVADGPAAQVSVPAADGGIAGEVELDHETPRVAITLVPDGVGHYHRLTSLGRSWRVNELHDQVGYHDGDGIVVVAGVVGLITLRHLTVGVGNGPQVVVAGCSAAGDGEAGVGRIRSAGRQAADGPAAQVGIRSADLDVGGEVELDHETPRRTITLVADGVGHHYRLTWLGRIWRVNGLHDQIGLLLIAKVHRHLLARHSYGNIHLIGGGADVAGRVGLPHGVVTRQAPGEDVVTVVVRGVGHRRAAVDARYYDASDARLSSVLDTIAVQVVEDGAADCGRWNDR